MMESPWTIFIPTLGLLVTARDDSRISPMHGMYALQMNRSFGYYFGRHLQMELVRSDGSTDRNKVISIEESFSATEYAQIGFFSPESLLWPHMRSSIPRWCLFMCWGLFLWALMCS